MNIATMELSSLQPPNPHWTPEAAVRRIPRNDGDTKNVEKKKSIQTLKEKWVLILHTCT